MSDINEKHCLPCNRGLNQYESDIYTTLIHWLETVTCIPWIRNKTDGGEPTELNSDVQYGTIYIQTVDDQEVELGEVLAVGDIERCREIITRSLVTINLSVYNYNTCQIKRSPIDVLAHIRTFYQASHQLQNELCAVGLSVNSWGVISNITEYQSDSATSRASQDITLEIKRYTSLTETLLNKIELSLDCCNNVE